MKELEELTREIQENLPRLMYIETLDFTYYKCKAKSFREPMLNDVFEFLWCLIAENHNNSYKITLAINTILHKSYKHCWNFDSPYLKDQSPGLIKFLHSLIKTKQ